MAATDLQEQRECGTANAQPAVPCITRLCDLDQILLVLQRTAARWIVSWYVHGVTGHASAACPARGCECARYEPVTADLTQVQWCHSHDLLALLQAYWPFHKDKCRRNEFADVIEQQEPKFAQWMREHSKQAVLKDDEVDRLERASKATSGSSRQEVLQSMYGRLDPKPRSKYPHVKQHVCCCCCCLGATRDHDLCHAEATYTGHDSALVAERNEQQRQKVGPASAIPDRPALDYQ